MSSIERPAGPRRSVLYVPAVNARAVEKARNLACDVVVFDLEDAVGPDAKDQARQAAVDILALGGFGGRELAVRINGLSTPWGEADLAAIAATAAGAVVLPKVNGPQDVVAADAALGGSKSLWAMIETCAALVTLREIAALSQGTGLDALMLGTNDLAAELRCELTGARENLSWALQSAVAAARAYGLTALDGTFNDFKDPAGLAEQCRQGAALGFDGKTLIHPSQIEAANAAFSPSEEALAWARRVIAAFDLQPNAGVLNLDGQMIERLHLAEARRTLARAGEG